MNLSIISVLASEAEALPSEIATVEGLVTKLKNDPDWQTKLKDILEAVGALTSEIAKAL